MVIYPNKNISISSTLAPQPLNNGCSIVERMLNKSSREGGMIMTTDQLTYARDREAARHNREMEAQGRRQLDISHLGATAAMRSADASMAHAGAQYASVGEQRRHNLVQEDIGWNQYYSLAGLQRAQSGALAQDSSTKRFQAESTDQHYQRSDTIAAFKAGTGALTDTMQALARIYMVP